MRPQLRIGEECGHVHRGRLRLVVSEESRIRPCVRSGPETGQNLGQSAGKHVCAHECGLAVPTERDPVASVEPVRDHAYRSRLGVEAVHLVWHEGQWTEVVQESIPVRGLS